LLFLGYKPYTYSLMDGQKDQRHLCVRILSK
jgi:hypothetical protein